MDEIFDSKSYFDTIYARPVMLETKNLSQIFRHGNTERVVLNNINLSIHKREFICVIGPSGCGKSTLLRTLNRMYDLYPGQRAEARPRLRDRHD